MYRPGFGLFEVPMCIKKKKSVIIKVNKFNYFSSKQLKSIEG